MLNLVLMLSALSLAEIPVDITSRVESGWTSNATESVGGAPDFYVRHSHDLSVTVTEGPLSLRGGLSLDQQVFRRQSGENDLSLTAGVEAALELSENLALRAGYAVTQSWTGEIADVGPLLLTIRSPALEHELLGELVVSGPGRRLVFGFDAVNRQPGPSEFGNALLPPFRLDPEVMQVTGRVDGEWAVTPDMTGLAGLHWTVMRVPDIDRFLYGREPAQGARLTAGFRLQQGILTAEARGGVDLVWPEAAPQLMRQLPYLDAAVDLAVTDYLSVNARLASGIEFFNPVDSVAGRTLEGELGARLALTDALGLALGVSLSRETGLYNGSLEITRRDFQGGVAWSVGSHFEARLAVSHADVEEPVGPYGISVVGLTLSGKV